jgi:hypothetical protein
MLFCWLIQESMLFQVLSHYAQLQNPNKNPAFAGIDFLGSLHLSDHPNSPNYPDYGRDKYPCGFRWNCPICCFHDYTLHKFKELQDRGRQTTVFRKGYGADSEENWNVDKMAAIREVLDIIEPVLTASMQLTSLADVNLKANMAVLKHKEEEKEKEKEKEEDNNNSNVVNESVNHS